MVAAQYRFNAGFLKRTELAPTERVDDVVLNKRIKSFERAHRFRRMSSTGLRDGMALPANARAPLDQLRGTKPLILYFGNDVDRDEFIALMAEAKPNMRSVKL